MWRISSIKLNFCQRPISIDSNKYKDLLMYVCSLLQDTTIRVTTVCFHYRLHRNRKYTCIVLRLTLLTWKKVRRSFEHSCYKLCQYVAKINIVADNNKSWAVYQDVKDVFVVVSMPMDVLVAIMSLTGTCNIMVLLSIGL